MPVHKKKLKKIWHGKTDTFMHKSEVNGRNDSKESTERSKQDERNNIYASPHGFKYRHNDLCHVGSSNIKRKENNYTILHFGEPRDELT